MLEIAGNCILGIVEAWKSRVGDSEANFDVNAKKSFRRESEVFILLSYVRLALD